LGAFHRPSGHAGTASSSLRSAAGDPQADQEIQRPNLDPLRSTHAAGPGRPPEAGGIHADLPQDHALSPTAGLQGPDGRPLADRPFAHLRAAQTSDPHFFRCPMKIAVLSRNPRLSSTRRLVEAGQQRGYEMVVIDTLRAYMNIASHKPQIHYRGRPLGGFDAVIPRIGASVTLY